MTAYTKALTLLSPAAALFLAAGAMAQAPANDSCSAAQLVTAGVYSGTTVPATNDGSASCGSSSRTADVWYRFVAPNTGTLTASTCGSALDTVLSIHSACPSGAVSNTLVCNDDSCGSQSNVSRALTAGQEVIIRVSGFLGATGTFTLTVGFTVTPPPPPGNIPGPNVTTFNLVDVARYGTGTSNGENVTAYAVGTDSCNRGTIPVTWIDQGPRWTEHPVIAQNMFRYKVVNGAPRFEQLGQSWLKHGFLSTNSNGCGSCQQPPLGGDQLGVNCSDIYGAGLNGNQGSLGPRSQVNAATGVFPMPHGSGTGGTVGMRLQVPTAEVTGNQSGARFFVDAHYVTMDDAQFVAPGQSIAINGLDNASWREINIQNGTANPTFIGNTVQQVPGIYAWQFVDSGVSLVNADYLEAHPTNANNSIRARFIVGGKATQMPNGNWHYEYAVYNLNSHRSGASFTVPSRSTDMVAGTMGMSFPKSHSGEPYSNAPWNAAEGANNLVTWATDSVATNPNANAIRWGTMYSFRFDSTAAPTTGNATIGLFRAGNAGDPATVTVPGLPVPTVPSPCVADFDGNGTLNPDDLSSFITGYFTNPPIRATDFNNDNIINPDDLSDYITAFFLGC